MPSNDVVFVLRFWRETCANGSLEGWRVRVNCANTRTRIYVDGVEEAFAAVRATLDDVAVAASTAKP